MLSFDCEEYSISHLLSINDGKYYIGLFQEEGLLVKGEWVIRISKNEKGVYERFDYNLKTKELRMSKKEKTGSEFISVSNLVIESNCMIDVSNDGMRWEGSCLNRSPFGYGSLYNSSNELIYRGVMIGDKKECFGIMFYPDVGQIEYIGCYWNNERHGFGMLYDRKGELVYEGDFICGSSDFETSVILKDIDGDNSNSRSNDNIENFFEVNLHDSTNHDNEEFFEMNLHDSANHDNEEFFEMNLHDSAYHDNEEFFEMNLHDSAYHDNEEFFVVNLHDSTHYDNEELFEVNHYAIDDDVFGFRPFDSGSDDEMYNHNEIRRRVIVNVFEGTSVHSLIRELRIDKGCGNEFKGDLLLCGFDYLERIVIKKNSCQNVNCLKISDNPVLKSIEIEDGEWSMRKKSGVFMNVRNVIISSMMIDN